MSLQLLVNNERSSNGSIFYRSTSSSPFSAVLSLSSNDGTSVINNDNYFATFTLNGSQNISMFSPVLTALAIFTGINTPNVQTISVTAYDSQTFLATNVFTMSAVFANNFPTATFVAFPSSFVTQNGNYNYYARVTDYTQTSSLPVSSYLADAAQYGSGAAFYGEGHTEYIVLSTHVPSGYSAYWQLGPYSRIVTSDTTSIALSTIPNDTSVYPVSLQLFNGTTVPLFTTNIKYDDSTGIQSYYSFYNSSINVDGTPNTTGSFTRSLSVLKYPDPPYLNQYGFSTKSDFLISNSFVLPFTYNQSTHSFGARSFYAELDFPSNNQNLNNIPFQTTLQQIYWNINAVADPSLATPNWSVPLTIALSSQPNVDNNTNSSSISLKISYADQDDIVDQPLRASLGYKEGTNININGSVTVLQSMDLSNQPSAPIDWQPKLYTLTFNSSANIIPLPISNLYTDQYYAPTGTNVNLTNVSNVQTLSTQSLYSSVSTTFATDTNSVVLKSQLFGTDKYHDYDTNTLYLGPQDIGFVTLTADTAFSILGNNTIYDFKYLLPNIFNVVPVLDDVQPNHFYSEYSPFTLTYSSAPAISPNEWVTSDNVNSMIDKIMSTLSELDGYSSLYKDTHKVTGRLDYFTTARTTITGSVLGSVNLPSNILQPIPQSSFVTFNSQSILAPILTNGLTAIQIDTSQGINGTIIPANGLSALSITLSTDNIYPIYYALTTITTLAATQGYQWIVETIDPISFGNWPQSNSINMFTGCVICPQSGKIVLSQQNKFIVNDNTYNISLSTQQASVTALQQISIDNIFEYSNLQAISVNSNDFIVTLDSNILRVSVFTVQGNNIVLFTTWGGYGLQSSKQGFSAPNDIHIDQDNFIWIADTGNNCVKKFTINGKNTLIITHPLLTANTPLSLCVDSQYNVHVLTQIAVYVFDQYGNYLFEYDLPASVTTPQKINTSYNRECTYITFDTGIVKYFRTGVFYQYIINNNFITTLQKPLSGFNSIFQDAKRNLYVTVNNQIMRIADIMQLQHYRAPIDSILWTNEQLYVHDDEYVQPWVYMKSFHRLWDNIELFRTSLFYRKYGNRLYTPPTYQKSDLVIGQNELVTNAVINRLVGYLWTNLESIINYFNPNYFVQGPVRNNKPTPTSTYANYEQYTPTPTHTSTWTPPYTPTITPTTTPTQTQTKTPTQTPTQTSTQTQTPTITPTSTVTQTVTPTFTPTLTPAVYDIVDVRDQSIDIISSAGQNLQYNHPLDY